MIEPLQSLVDQLTHSNAKTGCEAMETLLTLSGQTDSVYRYFDQLIQLLDHKSSFVRNRAIALIAANVVWDTQGKLEQQLDRLLPHIADPKPITARQCIQALPRIAVARPELTQRIRAALEQFDPSGYAESMAPLVARDRVAALNALDTDGHSGKKTS